MYNENESSSQHKKIEELTALSDILRVHTNLEDPVDVRNEPQQGTKVLKLLVLQKKIVSLNSHFCSLLRKPDLYNNVWF